MNEMTFAGICLITNNVRRLSNFYQKILQTTSDCDDEIHQEIHTDGAAMAILYCESSNGGNPNISMAFTVDDVDDEYARLVAMDVTIINKPTLRPWGAKNMRFCDPDGNFIVFRSFPKES